MPSLKDRSEIERIVDIDGSMAVQSNELYVASYQGRLAAIDAGQAGGFGSATCLPSQASELDSVTFTWPMMTGNSQRI